MEDLKIVLEKFYHFIDEYNEEYQRDYESLIDKFITEMDLKNKPMSLQDKIDWIPYEKGMMAASKFLSTKEHQDNPYIKDTDKWMNWNRGWNERIDK